MKRILIATATSLLIFAASTAGASPNDEGGDCFPDCPAAAATVQDNVNACELSLVRQADELNDRIKPIRDMVGYVRSPQGLAIKLVNDHVVSIPGWVGYAIDPVGSLKRRAMEEVRDRARSAIGISKEHGCRAADIASPDAGLDPSDEI